MIHEKLASLSKLTLVLHPTNCRYSQDLLLLYSSVTGEEIWHLSLIGPTIPENPTGPRETWWEGKWSMEELQNLVPLKSPDELINQIGSSFSNDDIALIGYREGNEAEIRVTIGYSTSDAFTISLARVNSASESPPSSTQKPFLNLLKITCEAYQQLNSRKLCDKDIGQARSANCVDQDTNRIVVQSSSSQISAAPDRPSVPHGMKRNPSPSPQCTSIGSSAGPGKKVRIAVTDRFLDSDESD